MANPPTGGGDARTTTSNLAPGKRALVGAATAVRGQVSAGEDIWIEGQLEGELHAAAHQVTISPGGRVRAQVRARTVIVEGELHGDVFAEQQVVLRSGSRVHGDLRAPRVALEEGCFFQGNVDMDGGGAATAANGAPRATEITAPGAAANASAGEPVAVGSASEGAP